MVRIPHGAAPASDAGKPARYLGTLQVSDYAHAAGFRGHALAVAVAIAMAESSNNVNAMGDIKLQTATWGPSIGLWQVRSLIRDYGTGRERDAARLFDPAFNARAAYSISRGGTTFRPWSTYQNGAYKAYMGLANDTANVTTHPDPAAREAGADPAFVNPNRGKIFAPHLPDDGGIPLRVSGHRLTGELGNLFVGGRLSYSMDESSMLTTSFLDDGYTLSDRYWVGVGAVIDWGGVHWEVTDTTVDYQGATPITTLRSIPSGVRAMKRTSTGSRGAMSPTTFMAAVAKAAGLGFFGEPTKAVTVIAPAAKNRGGENDPLLALVPSLKKEQMPATETAWELGERLATDAGFVMFETRGTLNFASPEYLYQELPRHMIAGDGRTAGDKTEIIPIGRPQVKVTATTWTQTRNKGVITRRPYANDISYTVDLPAEVGSRLRVGQSVGFSGMGPYGYGRARNTILASADFDLGDYSAPITVTTRTNNVFKAAASDAGPVTAAGESTATDGGYTGNATAAGKAVHGSKRAVDMVSFALRQAGDRYIYGAEARLSDPNPDAFDCSELVQWACAQVGVTITDGSRYQKAYCQRKGTMISIARAQRTRGAVMFLGSPVHHIGISLGDGKRTIEARGRAYGVNIFSSRNRFDSAALVPGLRY